MGPFKNPYVSDKQQYNSPFGFLNGPLDMLTLYENKYKQEVQKFANEQVGRRRRDDYTDGTVRIPVTSANP